MRDPMNWSGLEPFSLRSPLTYTPGFRPSEMAFPFRFSAPCRSLILSQQVYFKNYFSLLDGSRPHTIACFPGFHSELSGRAGPASLWINSVPDFTAFAGRLGLATPPHSVDSNRQSSAAAYQVVPRRKRPPCERGLRM
jgi:hypothetical protein